MKIATWNIERYKPSRQSRILKTIQEIDADILVLTETYSSIKFEGYVEKKSKQLPLNMDGQKYREGENRTSIYTKFPIIATYETYNEYTSVCADIHTPQGILTVYASIIGILGNKQPHFNNDLEGQIKDFEKIFPSKENICIMGDLNTTFSGRVYPSSHARTTLNKAFEKYNLVNLTKDIDNNVDHIIVSKNFCSVDMNVPSIWNANKDLSDHIGISVKV